MENKLFYLFLIQAVTAIATVILVSIACILSWALFLEFKSQNQEEYQFACGTVNPIEGRLEPEQAQLGKDLFRSNCATCHNRNMRDKLTGPALAGVTGRWLKYPKEDLYNFIRDSQKMIKNKHPRAVQVWNENDYIIMNAFPNLKNEDIEAILAYIEYIQNGAYDKVEYQIID